MLAKLRKFIFRKPLAPKQALAGRTYIVTGCADNSVGYATAQSLLECGAEVCITRRHDTGAAINRLKIDVPDASTRIFGADLDLTDAESVSNFADWYTKDRQSLDVLINNAGIHLDLLSQWSEPVLSLDKHEIHWRTNYLGTTQLTNALLPLLLQQGKATGDARIVNVISMLHTKGSNADFFGSSRPYNSWNAYGQSKLGLLHFTKALQSRYGAAGLKAFALHPGEVYTNIAGKGLQGNPLIESIRKALAPLEKFMLMTPHEGAQTSLLCATSPNVIGGEYYRNCEIAPASTEADDRKVTDKLWHENQQWLETLQSP